MLDLSNLPVRKDGMTGTTAPLDPEPEDSKGRQDQFRS